jgi:hypothetical protein
VAEQEHQEHNRKIPNVDNKNLAPYTCAGKIVEAVGRRGQEVNRSIALPLCLMSYMVLHRRSVSQG